jgi:hypothetical protein
MQILFGSATVRFLIFLIYMAWSGCHRSGFSTLDLNSAVAIRVFLRLRAITSCGRSLHGKRFSISSRTPNDGAPRILAADVVSDAGSDVSRRPDFFHNTLY